MNDNTEIGQVVELVAKDFQIEGADAITKDQLLALIAQRVSYLLENDKDLLLSYLYRLDISMKKINAMLKLKNVIPPHESIAQLIFQRQMERIHTKKKIVVKPIEDGWEL